ncbi:GNAT family N-acetyltransferase [Alloscardovia criceti]|uniref:GNAT family N-acetyltransferase n=1 Tax=Alloscardovia criceti TaxID=356828 RepID=UPI000379654B|nr:GNAT family N-acetyltransferase [Alloscardovia criceti]
MPHFVIRNATEKDIPAITEIYNEAVLTGDSTADIDVQSLEQRRAWVNAHTPRDQFPVVVVEVEGTVAGFASLSRFHPRPGYDGVVEVSYYIGSQWQGHGFGHAVLDWLESAARERGYRKLIGIIFADNMGSIALMNKHGFIQYGLLPDATHNNRVGKVHDMSFWYKDL